MPSIQDALKQALERAVTPTPAPTGKPAIPSDWDDEGGAKEISETTTTNEEKAMQLPQTTNISRETFEHIRNNPGITRMELMAALTKRGFNPKTTSSLLAQMKEQHMVTGDSREGLFASIDTYRPIKQRPPVGRKTKAQRKQRAATRRSERTVDTPQPVEKRVEQWSPDTVLNGLSVIQARAVYDELKKLFGG